MARKTLLRTEWECDRCKHIDQTSALVPEEEFILPTPAMPPGWTQVTFNLSLGVQTQMDLCSTCQELLIGVSEGRYSVAEPDVETKEESKPKATRKRAAKKAVKKPDG